MAVCFTEAPNPAAAFRIFRWRAADVLLVVARSEAAAAFETMTPRRGIPLLVGTPDPGLADTAWPRIETKVRTAAAATKTAATTTFETVTSLGTHHLLVAGCPS